MSLPRFEWVLELSPDGSSEQPYDPLVPADQQAKASISGRVVGLDSGPAGPAVALYGATVTLQGPTTPASSPFSTAQDGNFAFDTLIPGTYTVSVAHPTHYPVTYSLVLGPGKAATQGAQLVVLSSQSGDVTQAHVTGVVHKAGQLALPVAQQDHSGITVEVVGAGVRTVTSLAGEFDLYLNPGVYELQLTTPNYLPLSVPNVIATASTLTQIPNNPLTLSANPGSVAGTVTIEGQSSGAFGSVTVALFGGGSTQTAADGTYLLSGVAPGVYTLTVGEAGYTTQTLSGINVQGGLQTTAPAVMLPISRGSVSGTVILAGNNDASGVTIALVGTSFVATTNVAGQYTIAGVPVGNYDLTAQKQGFVPAVSGGLSVVAASVVTVPSLTLPAAQGAFSINGGNVYTNQTNVTLQLTAQGAAEMRISQDPNFANASLGDTALRTFSSTATFSLQAEDGLKTLYVQYSDASSTLSNIFNSSIVLDTTPPVASNAVTPMMQIDNSAAYTRMSGGLVTLQMAVSDATSYVTSMQLGGALPLTGVFQPYVSELTYTLPNPTVDGNKTVYANFSDAAGNVLAVPVSATITLDTTPPSLTGFTATCLGVTPATTCNNSVVTLNIASPDAAMMAFSDSASRPGTSFVPYATTATFLLDPGDDLRTAAVVLQDAAGNVSSVPGVLSVTVDTDPPESPILIINNNSAYTNSPNVTLQLSATGASSVNLSNCSDFNTVNCQTTGWQSFSASPATASWAVPIGDGLKTVFAEYQDAASNISNVAQASITLDQTPPSAASLVLITQNSINFTNAPLMQMSLLANGASTMQVSCNGSLAGAVQVPFATAASCSLPSGDGQKSVVALFIDNANNSTPVGPVTVYYDGTPPTPPSIGMQPLIVNEPNISVPLSVASTDAAVNQDPNPTGTHFVYQLKGGQYSDWTDCGTALAAMTWSQDATCSGPPFNFILATNTTNNLGVRARDRGGNVSSQDGVVITHDSIAPAYVNATVSAGDGYVILQWPPSTSTDVAGYYVVYGFSNSTNPNQYTGTAASQGFSPINVGLPCGIRNGVSFCSFELTGLADGQQLYVNVLPYDKTQIPGANVSSLWGGIAITPGQEVLTTSAETLALGNASLAVHDGVAYLSGTTMAQYMTVQSFWSGGGDVIGHTTAPPDFWTAGAYYMRGGYNYVLNGNTFITVDVTNPANPNVVNVQNYAASTPSLTFTRVVGDGNAIYVFAKEYISALSEYETYVAWFDTGPGACSATASPAAPCLTTGGAYLGLNASSLAGDIAAQGNYVYVADSTGKFTVTDPVNGIIHGSLTTPSGQALTAVAVSGAYAYVGDAKGTLDAVNISNPNAPFIATSAATSANVDSIAISGDRLYAVELTGVDIYELTHTSDSVNLTFLFHYSNYVSSVSTIRAEGEFLYQVSAPNFYMYKTTSARSIQPTGSAVAVSSFSANPIVVDNNIVLCDNGNILAYTGDATSPTLYAVGHPFQCYNLAHEGSLIVGTINSSFQTVHLAENGNFTNNTTFNHLGWNTLAATLSWPYLFAVDQNATTTTMYRMATYDVRNPTTPFVAQVALPTPAAYPGTMVRFGNYLYTVWASSLLIVDATTPMAPVVAAVIPFSAAPTDIAFNAGRLYVAYNTYFRILELASSGGTLTAPVDVGGMTTPCTYITANAGIVHCGSSSSVSVIDSTSTTPTLLNQLNIGSVGKVITYSDRLAFSRGAAGLQIAWMK